MIVVFTKLILSFSHLTKEYSELKLFKILFAQNERETTHRVSLKKGGIVSQRVKMD